jgi:uncharacterized membrane protein YfcA
MTLIYIVLVGVLSGILSAFFGIGGGTVLVPAFIYLFGFPIQVAIGTSLLAIIPTTLVGSWRHWGYGNVNLATALWVGLFAAVGAVLGAYLTTKVPPLLLRKLFALFLVAVAIHLFLKK